MSPAMWKFLHLYVSKEAKLQRCKKNENSNLNKRCKVAKAKIQIQLVAMLQKTKIQIQTNNTMLQNNKVIP